MSMLGCMFDCMRHANDFADKIGANPQNPDGSIQGKETDQGVTAVHKYFIDGMALTGIGSAICTMIFTTGHLVDIASIATLGFAPLAGYQKRKLMSLGGFRGQCNILRDSVNTLQSENTKLHGSLDKLETTVTDLQGVEGQLSEIAIKARTNVDKLQFIVQENKRIINAINKNLQAQITQDLIEVVLTADKDEDNTIGPKELDMIVLRMNNMPGFNFDQGNFRKAIGGRTSVGLREIMAIIRNLDDDSVPEEENIFHMDPKQILKK